MEFTYYLCSSVNFLGSINTLKLLIGHENNIISSGSSKVLKNRNTCVEDTCRHFSCKRSMVHHFCLCTPFIYKLLISMLLFNIRVQQRIQLPKKLFSYFMNVLFFHFHLIISKDYTAKSFSLLKYISLLCYVFPP